MTFEIRSLADIEKIEETPIEERFRGETVYDTLCATVAEHGDQIAITELVPDHPLEDGHDVTFAQLLGKVNQAANMLRDLGLLPDQSVTDLLPLGVQGLVMKIASETIGIASPVNPMLEVEHLEGIARAANARIMLTPGKAINPAIYEKAIALADGNENIHTVLLMGGGEECDGQRVRSLEDTLALYPSDEITGGVSGTLDDIVGYYHTGGTTGVPKLAKHTQRMRVVQTVSTSMMLGYQPGDSVMLGLPMFHIAGSVICGLIPLLAGARLVLVDPRGYRGPEVMPNFWSIIGRHNITITVCVPTIVSGAITVPVGDADLSGLRMFAVGGAPIPSEVLRRASAMAGVTLRETFGMTELGSVTTFQLESETPNIGSVGVRMPYVQAKIALESPDGSLTQEAAPNEIGILCFHGPCVTPGYVGGRAQSETFSDDGWLITGDLARIDEEGEIWITGRSKDMIIRGGHNIDPMVIEEALSLHPSVELAAAIGRPDAYTGEMPIAYVQLKPGEKADPSELVAFARSNVSERAAAPAEVIVMEKLPMTGFDKVFKPALRHDAIKRTYDRLLADDPRLDCDFDISVNNDKEAGTLATIVMATAERKAAEKIVQELLAPFPIKFRVFADA